MKTPAIIEGITKSGVYRARDVRADIKELGFEKGIERAVTLMCDEQVGLRQTVIEQAQMLDNMLGILGQITQINGAMAQEMHLMRTRDDKYEASKET